MPTHDTATERGPPEQRSQLGVSRGQVAVDDESLGALASPSTAYTTYDALASPAQGDNFAGAAR